MVLLVITLGSVTALCSEGSMLRKYSFKSFYVQKVLFSEGSIFRRSYVQKVLCSEGSMFRRSYVQKYSFTRSYIQKVLYSNIYSEGPIFRIFLFYVRKNFHLSVCMVNCFQWQLVNQCMPTWYTDYRQTDILLTERKVITDVFVIVMKEIYVHVHVYTRLFKTC